MDAEVVAWVRTNFLPCEATLRAMLIRMCACEAEVDDVIQEAYYKVLTMPSLAHVREPRAFLIRLARNILIDRVRHENVIRIDGMVKLEDLEIEDTAPTPERIASGRAELKWMIGLIANLPGRCKAVFRARRIYGLTQADTASTLGISESVVEHETMRGMKLISEMVERVGVNEQSAPQKAGRKFRGARKTHVND